MQFSFKVPMIRTFPERFLSVILILTTTHSCWSSWLVYDLSPNLLTRDNKAIARKRVVLVLLWNNLTSTRDSDMLTTTVSLVCGFFFTVQLVGWFLLNVFHCSWEMTFTPAMFSVWVCVWSVCVSWFVCVCCLLICCRYFSYFSVVVVVVCVILSMDKLIDDQWRAASLRQLPVMLQRDR